MNDEIKYNNARTKQSGTKNGFRRTSRKVCTIVYESFGHPPWLGNAVSVCICCMVVSIGSFVCSERLRRRQDSTAGGFITVNVDFASASGAIGGVENGGVVVA